MHKKTVYKIYFFKKCRKRLNIKKSIKAKNIIQLKILTTTRKPSTAEINTLKCF